MSAKKAGCKLGKLHSRVYVMDKQAQYLSYQIEGGTRTPRGTAIVVPTSNLKLITSICLVVRIELNGCSRRSTYSKKPSINGVAGIW
nr:hypothetical protein [Rhodospirillales bacterium]